MNDQTPEERITDLEQRIDVLSLHKDTVAKYISELEQRLAALESQAKPEAEAAFTPGYQDIREDLYEFGVSGKDIGITFTYYVSLNVIEFSAYGEGDGVEFDLTKTQLRQLIGAAQAVLKRMEAEQSDD
jgi:hypothetical protein